MLKRLPDLLRPTTKKNVALRKSYAAAGPVAAEILPICLKMVPQSCNDIVDNEATSMGIPGYFGCRFPYIALR